MPCFDPKDVIFITNKWDSLGHSNDESDEDSSDEHEVTETWNALQIMIRKKWPAVKEDHIFKLNLKMVNISRIKWKLCKFYTCSCTKDKLYITDQLTVHRSSREHLYTINPLFKM